MKAKLKAVINVLSGFSLFFSSAQSLYAADTPLPQSLLEVMHQSRYQNAQWWIEVKDLNSKETLYQFNADHLLMPASATKLFSTAAALNILGDDYRFKTPIYFIGQQENETLNGSLILVGKGDLELGGRVTHDKLTYGFIDHIYANDLPGATITPENPLNGLIDLAKQIKAKGVKKINGNVLVDNRLFETEYRRGYTFSPVMINENLLDFQIKPSSPNQKALVEWRPQVTGYSINNQIMTVAESEKTTIQVTANEENTVFTLKGQIAANSAELLRVYPIIKPDLLARQALIDALKEQGIEVTLSQQSIELPEIKAYQPLSPFVEYVSPPLSEYVKIILKLSHNIGADLIPLLLAHHNHETTSDEGMPLIAKFLIGTVGIGKNEFVFGDGAGGDSNRLLPKAALQLLEYMHHLPSSQFKKYYDALPILGVDGSLKQAAANIPAVGKVHAKTGTSISYDSANQRFYSFSEVLSGYIEAQNGHLLAFVIAVSNTPMESIDDAFIIQKDVSKVASEIYNHAKS